MDYNEIKKLMDDMGESKLDSLEIEFPEGIKISMKKNTNKGNAIITQQPQPMVISQAPGVPTVQVSTENSLVNVPQEDKKEENKDENLKIVKSPMVGTFYSSPSPDKEAFVHVGDKVHKGQVICIVEAMKLMNEIESEYDGEIVEVCVNNEDIVEYGTPLFKIK